MQFARGSRSGVAPDLLPNASIRLLQNTLRPRPCVAKIHDRDAPMRVAPGKSLHGRMHTTWHEACWIFPGGDRGMRDRAANRRVVSTEADMDSISRTAALLLLIA